MNEGQHHWLHRQTSFKCKLETALFYLVGGAVIGLAIGAVL